MKFMKIVSAFVILWIVLIAAAILVSTFSDTGCACMPKLPSFSVNEINNSTGHYVNVTYVHAVEKYPVKNLKVNFTEGNTTTIQFVNGTLVEGTSYIFKLSQPNRTHVSGIATLDNWGELGVIETDLFY